MKAGLEISYCGDEKESVPAISLRIRVAENFVVVRSHNEKGNETWLRSFIPFEEWDRIVAFVRQERDRLEAET
jgi:hypothetical protein